MVDRINVVLVSRPNADQRTDRSTAERLTEAIVGNLAGRPGIDLVLVTPLADIQNDSTDQLTLSAIHSGTAVLTWSTPTDTIADLNKLGIPSVRCRHAGDPDAAADPAAGRGNSVLHQVYAFDLRKVTSVDQLMDDLDQLRRVRAVKTFSLGGLASVRPSLAPPIVKAPSKPDQTSKPDQISGSDQPGPSKPEINNQSIARQDQGDSGLDALIDSLDEFDR